MKISDVLQKGKGTLSFEIFPPKGDFDVQGVRSLLGALSPLSPAYISVTYSAGGSKNNRLTEEIASMAQEENHIPSACHITVINSTNEEVENTIDSFHRSGIENVLALRGDKVDGAEGGSYLHATDIIPSLVKKGFCVGASCYPEGHPLSPSLAGVTAPISAGIMPIMSKAQVNRMIFMCAVSLPGEIIRILNRYEEDKDGLLQAGLDYAAAQIKELYDAGADDVHFYTMNRPEAAQGLVQRLKALGCLRNA